MSVVCRICEGVEAFTVAYDGPVRSGGRDSGFSDGFRVLRCPTCGVEQLYPFPCDVEGFYSSESYWESHVGLGDLSKYHQRFDREQQRWFSEIGIGELRGKTVADFGCGVGLFLDLLQGVADRAVGIDLGEHLATVLAAKGMEFRNLKSLDDTEWLDVAVSFDTLEHVPFPRDFLEKVWRSLRPGGRLYLGVPNQADFLKQVVPSYVQFFYHCSHLWYFGVQSLAQLAGGLGFEDIAVRSIHKYDLMNVVRWASEAKGSGCSGGGPFDRMTDTLFRTGVERQGVGSHLLLSCRKGEEAP